MEKVGWLTLALLWLVFWRKSMMDAYHDWRYMRAQRKKLSEIDGLEDLFRE
jgi:hypothetical protein